ncbi:MAG TPA: porin [Prevotella sp.]|nr:porin [Prevotella sp.]
MRKGLLMAGLALCMTATASADVPDWFKMFKISGYGMTQYQYSGQEGAKANSFNIRLGRVIVDAKPHKDWAARVQFQYNGNTSDLSSSIRVVDVYAEWQKYEFFRIKGGQFKRAFTFENPMNPIDQGFMSYAQNITKLAGYSDRDGQSASNGRDIGVQIQGDFLKNANGRNLLHYQIGVFNGQGINTKDVDQQKNIIGGVWVMPVAGMRIGAFGWTGSYARKGNWTETIADPSSSVTPNATKEITHSNEVRKLNQNRYAFSFEYKKDGWTVRSEYIHSTGMAFAKSITNHGDANSKDCSLNENIGNKAQGVYGLVIAPIADLKKGNKIDFKARYDMYQPNGKTDMMKTQYEAGFNFHIGKNFTILTEYALVNDRTLQKHNYSMADAEVCFRF